MSCMRLDSQPRDAAISILVLGKDGFGVTAEHFKILNQQTQSRGIVVKLVICHDVETQARNHDMPLSNHWVYSINNLGEYLGIFWLSRLVDNMNGRAQNADYPKSKLSPITPTPQRLTF